MVEIQWIGTRVFKILFSPFKWLGMNSLFIYVLMESIHNILFYNVEVNYNGGKVSVWIWIYWIVSAPLKVI